MKGLSGAEYSTSIPMRVGFPPSHPRTSNYRRKFSSSLRMRFRRRWVCLSNSTVSLPLSQAGAAIGRLPVYLLSPRDSQRSDAGRHLAFVDPGGIYRPGVDRDDVCDQPKARGADSVSGTSTRLIAAGDFSPMPLPKQQDSLRDLTQSVNEMAARLAQLQATVQKTERFRLIGRYRVGWPINCETP